MSTLNHKRPIPECQADPREEILDRYFLGRTDVFAQWNQERREWECIRKDIPDYLLKSHLQGKISIATYPVNQLGNSLHSCLDIDAKNPEACHFLEWLKSWFEKRSILFLPEDTGGRGLHGWALFLCYVPAEQAVAVATLALDDYKRKIGHIPCPVEIFPKQAKPKDVGNPIRLPWGKHHSGNWGHFLNLSFQPDDEGAIKAIQNGRRTTEFYLDKIVPETAVKPHCVTRGGAHTQNEVLEMLGRPLLVGERRPTLVKLAGHLRFRGISEEVAVALLLPWAEKRFTESLPPAEVERHIRGIYQRYGVRERKVTMPSKWHAEVTL